MGLKWLDLTWRNQCQMKDNSVQLIIIHFCALQSFSLLSFGWEIQSEHPTCFFERQANNYTALSCSWLYIICPSLLLLFSPLEFQPTYESFKATRVDTTGLYSSLEWCQLYIICRERSGRMTLTWPLAWLEPYFLFESNLVHWTGHGGKKWSF